MDRSVTSDEQVRLFSQPCPHCDVPWTEEAVAAAVKLAEPEVVDLSPDMGPTLRDAQRGFGVEFQLALAVRNDLWKDPDADEESRVEGWRSIDSLAWKAETRYADDDPKEVKIGWLGTDGLPAITPDYEIQPGDQGLLFATRAYHGECAAALQKDEWQQTLGKLQMLVVGELAMAGFKGVKIDRSPAPERLLDVLYRDDPARRPDARTFGTRTFYNAVTTREGAFGVFWMAEGNEEMLLDLIGSGLSPRELAKISGGECPIIGANPVLLAKLRTVLSSRKRRLPGTR